MFKILSSLLGQIQQINMGSNSAKARFWATVLEAGDGQALLDVQGERIPVKVEVPVAKGERLLLERGEIRDDRLPWRLIQRINPHDGVLQPENQGGFIYFSQEQARHPYFLSVTDDKSRQGGACVRSWLFSIHTETLGIVAVAATAAGTTYSVAVLAENGGAVEHLSAMEIDKDSLQGVCFEGTRVMREHERNRLRGIGSHLNRTQ